MNEKITMESFKKMAVSCQKMKSKPLPKGISWLTKIMNKFGWHREYEVLVFDKEQFKIKFPLPNFEINK